MTTLVNRGSTRRWLIAILSLLAALSSMTLTATAADTDASRDPLSWPAITQTNCPWTRWWWMGSAVDEPNLTRLLEEYQKAGIGGVEICPIYGAHGYEDRFIEYLSPKWMQMLAHTTREAKRLDMGVDMTTGTGWPFGGPNVSNDDASARTVQKTYDVAGGATISERLPAGRLQCLIAFAADKQQIDLTSQVKDGRLQWTAPSGTWRIYAVLANGPVQKVKRAAPGGEGSVLDPFSVAKLDRYLSRFDAAFSKYDGLTPRGQFHDSYEYYNASWTDELFSEFAKRRGYDLRAQLPAFFGEGAPEIVARVKCDYRETISDLHLDYVHRWTQWAHGHGSLTRNQAHGAPANLIDVYGAADIPETEIFARYEERHLPMLKFSSSAAHLKGTVLASSESFTWLGEHFNVPLSQVKKCADFLMLSGVNHILFHGIPYSPQDAPWPGWQFYAAVNFGPTGGLWHDLPAFNSYVAHCQSILQSGRPDSDVLLYVPFQDIWQTPRGLLTQFTTPGEWMFQQPFYETAVKLWERGYQYDELSDRFLAGAKVEDGAVTIGGNRFKTILLPPMNSIPVPTMRKLLDLQREGATIAVQNGLPTDVPGFANFEQRRAELKELLGGLKFEPAGDGMQKASIGKGSILIGSNLDGLLGPAGARREPMIDSGLRFVRRTSERGRQYFVVNSSDRAVDSWITLAAPAKAAALLDPMNPARTGLASLRQTPDQGTQVYLQLHAGESCIVRTFTDTPLVGKTWPYVESAAGTITLSGPWKVSFIEGGPELPKAYETSKLASWTTRDDSEAKRFAGSARYQIDFDFPASAADDYLLDLGTVHESARVRLNGREVATLIAPPYQIAIGSYLHPGANSLEIEVTNLAANRIADMDRRKVNWKYFYDANVSSLQQRNGLDASNWPLRDSGLMGPATIQQVKRGHNP